MKKYQLYSWKIIRKGFTLIELMIVIGIIGILAVIGTNQYTDYIIRAQVTEGINLLEGAKYVATEHLATNGEWPNTIAELSPIYPVVNIDTTLNGAKYVEFMNTSGGTTSYYKLKIFFRSDLSSKIAGKEIRFSSRDKTHADNGVLWQCQTTIDPDYYAVLPPVCRYPLNNSF